MRTARLIAGALAVAGFLYILDHLTKDWLFDKPALMAGFSYFGGLIQLTDHRNLGITFDIPIPQLVIIPLTIGVILLIIPALLRAAREQKYGEVFALGLILGGAFGNLTDRLTLGYVRDWLLLFGRSAINVADVSVAGGLVWYVMQGKRKPQSPPESTNGNLAVGNPL